MKKRIFIAINLPEEIKKGLVKYQKNIEELFTPYNTSETSSGLIRWTKQKNLHITLFFLGYIVDGEIPEVLEILETVAQNHKPFSIKLNQVSYGPPKKMPPRMIWAAGEDSEDLIDLHNDLKEAMLDSSLRRIMEKEKRSLSIHITLARIKEWEFRRIEPDQRPEINKDINLNFKVNSIELMESQLKKTGPEYTMLQSYNLK